MEKQELFLARDHFGIKPLYYTIKNGEIIFASEIKAILANKKPVVRNPKSIRPWQHVLEPLKCYLLLGAKLLKGKKEFATAWNFGPENNEIKTVEQIVTSLCKKFGKVKYATDKTKHFYETQCLKLDISKAKKELGLQQKWNTNIALDKIVAWTKAYQQKQDIRKVCIEQIKDFMEG